MPSHDSSSATSRSPWRKLLDAVTPHRHDFSEDCGLVAVPIIRDSWRERRCACGLYGYFDEIDRLQWTSKEPAQ